MKKQILILSLFTLALIFAGTSKSYGQALLPGHTATTPIPALSCAGNANFLHPASGISYDYEMTGNTGTENVSAWTWFATKNPDFILGGTLSNDSLHVGTAGELLDASANYGVVGSASNTVSITWSPEILAGTKYQGDATAAGTPADPSPTFVVGYGTGNCADNIQVYEINPVFNFTIDIANIESGTTLDWGVSTESCVDEVQSAQYNSTTHEITMNYGYDTLYFEVAAANFVTNWTPTFQFTGGLAGVQTAVVSLHDSYSNAKTQAAASALATTTWANGNQSTDWATGVALTATNATDVVSGVSAYVRVVITNSTYESLTTNPFTLIVDAVDASGNWDMEDADCTALDNTADQVDAATHTVNPRPTIEDANVPDSNPAAPNARITKTGE